MTRILITSLLFLSLSFFTPHTIFAGLGQTLSGKILLQVEQSGEAWYVYPETAERYYLGRPDDAYTIMRHLGLGITNANLEKVMSGDSSILDRVKGYILLQVEEHGEAYYVDPDDDSVTYMKDGTAAFSVMRSFGLGITDTNLDTIPVASDSALVDLDESYEYKTINTDVGSFNVYLVTMDKNEYDMITDTAEISDCEGDCSARYLADYIDENDATIGIHGTYFCPPDYSECAGQMNSFNPPVFNTEQNKLINESDLKYHDGPIMIYTEPRGYWMYHRASEFGTSVSAFESSSGENMLAGVAHYPSLIENGEIVVHSETVNSSQESKATRGGIGFNDDHVFLVVATGASVPDLAYIFNELGADWAINLDGGASAALYYKSAYKYGPNRLIPNAIVFKKK